LGKEKQTKNYYNQRRQRKFLEYEWWALPKELQYSDITISKKTIGTSKSNIGLPIARYLSNALKSIELKRAIFLSFSQDFRRYLFLRISPKTHELVL
jgi:hypothetical protein